MAQAPINISPQVLERIAEGDEQAFALLYAHFAPRLSAYAFQFTRSELSGEEILQESFLSVWLHRDQLLQVEHLQAWIYRIVARHCLQWLRKQRSEHARMERIEMRANEINIPTPSDILQWQELQAAIQQAIATLPGVRQQIFRLNREEGLKPAAIAEQLDTPVGTVKNHLSASLKIIRDHLIEAGYPIMLVLKLLMNFL